MPDKNFWIKKYEYINGLGHLYLIVDLIESDGNKHLVVLHEISVIKQTNDDPFKHEPVEYEFGSSQKDKQKLIDRTFKEHEHKITKRIKSNKDLNERNLPLEVVDSGEKVFEELQLTKFFGDLKSSIEKENISDSFKNYLDQLDQGPKISETKWSN